MISPSFPLALDHVYYKDPIIPVAWFHHLHLPSDAPDTVAILILADIVHWYYPKTTLDDLTHKYILHPREPYQLLQKSYLEFAILYGISKAVAISCRAVRRAGAHQTHLQDPGNGYG
ncbi:MAG: hypothetical protein IBJ00_07480 [Alphaproteobacteria bacterium]|nr:hypothetical protein [Alphaproteobacteria bacterium]